MACLHMKKKLSEYLDGELPADETAYVEEHIATCDDCKATLSEFKATLKHMSALEEVEPPAWFAEKVMQRVHEEAEQESFLRKLFYPLHIKLPAEALALVFVAVVAYYAYDVTRPELAMREVVSPETEVSVPLSGEPNETGMSFQNEDAIDEKPFTATPQVKEPEDEAMWDHEEFGGRAAAPKPALEKAPEAAIGNAKLEAAPEKARALPREKVLMKERALGFEREDRLAMEAYSEADKATTITEPSLKISMAVEDVDFAREDIEGIIVGLGGALVDKDRQPANVVIAVMDSDKLDDLLDALKSVGEIKSKTRKESQGKAYVRLELSEESSPSP